MLRMILSVTLMFLILSPMFGGAVARGQESDIAPLPLSGGSDGYGTLDTASVIVFWVLIALAAFFIALSVISYAGAFKGPGTVHQGHIRVLVAVALLVVAVLVRLAVFILERGN